ncbi:hypothetical protein M422DRAFT_237513 [Sphaerobolus stellatus SS14]|uniref:Uncharacterized protein n=1 Tax=Sphaerobolus stellatus (strain SS14) TaxID=990650 RepID=A0A0C9T5F0_SPHS4|nr:hypothetical protein M422DRAFT_237513 [Sphaerobolus stellatus SS14]
MSTTMQQDPNALYGYVPTFWVCVIFVTLFAALTVLHAIQALFFKPRLYWILPTIVLCGAAETVGWQRSFSIGYIYYSVSLIKQLYRPVLTYSLSMISCTILAPVFLTAALYAILGKVISIVGDKYSRLKARAYVKIFLIADTISLFVQGGRGGLSASASTVALSKIRTYVTLDGIIFQLVSILCYSVLATEVAYRLAYNKPHVRNQEDRDVRRASGLPTNIFLMMLSLGIATTLVFVRSVYRAIELGDGYAGTIIRTQVWFNVFDALPMTIIMFTLNILSPVFLLRNPEVFVTKPDSVYKLNNMT